MNIKLQNFAPEGKMKWVGIREHVRVHVRAGRDARGAIGARKDANIAYTYVYVVLRSTVFKCAMFYAQIYVTGHLKITLGSRIVAQVRELNDTFEHLAFPTRM